MSQGCTEEDINSILQAFSLKMDKIDRAYANVLKPGSTVATMQLATHLEPFMKSVEEIIDSELQTLTDYIKISAENKKQQTMNMSQFFDYIILWADVIWSERKEENENLKKNETEGNIITDRDIDGPLNQSDDMLRHVRNDSDGYLNSIDMDMIKD